ncbi:sporulation protein [Chengkuizengella axinellae]|uniref:Sporulation protein n=1 Tax=Chengkuizengella axinellae TaxID=3064388 RepID=A0ABT9IX55_9BACL|nr:sporulation protein [Chengkuizengella sp. 2205SS18-9]MDP5273956.1 sporulation protein [Chengkuizengella sp. 2205SS18-9]
MSFMKKMLSSIGIGSAKVDTVLNNDEFVPGDIIEGVVHIEGGKVEQKIEDVYLSIVTTYTEEREINDNEVDLTKQAVLNKIKISEPFTIGKGEKKEFPVQIQLPYDTPLTIGKTKAWIQTGLDIDNAVDPSDRDSIKITPNHLIDGLFKSLEDLGFRLYEVECEASKSLSNRLPFIQEFEFKPTSGPFKGKLDELEVVLFAEESQITVVLEVDRKARGFKGLLSEMLEKDESVIRFTYTVEDIPNLQNGLYEIIEKHS